MVAINRFTLTLFAATCCFCLSANAQRIQPSIVGLETNPRYMSLLSEDEELSTRESHIAVEVESLREIYRLNQVEATQSRDKIISLENELFDLRARKAIVADSLNIIEQDWVLNNMSDIEPFERKQTPLLKSDENIRFIYLCANAKGNLSNIDYQNLIKSETMEVQAEEYRNQYIANYENMLSLQSSYQVAATQVEADAIKESFDSLKTINSTLMERLDTTWGYIYDNKSFAYSILMETLGFSDILKQEADLMRNAQAEISSKAGDGASDELLRYMVQKSSMIEYEMLVASKLELKGTVDSLGGVLSKISLLERVSPPDITIEERLFIDYQPIVFTPKAIYSSINAIPKTQIYERGVIFRIFVGSFQTKPTVAVFRNATPLSQMADGSRTRFYIGGYATYEQAVEAQALLKKRGFRAPQITVWLDGRERNLTTDPIAMTTTFRVEISDVETLPAGVGICVESLTPNSSISKIGTDKFVVAPLERQSQVDSLLVALRAVDSQLNIKVEKSESKIEF